MHARTTHFKLRRGFSLIELLVVVGVVSLLLASLTVAGTSAIYAARAKNTRQVIAQVEFALDIFKEENPLRLVYDRPGAAIFGPLPAYQLANTNIGGRTLPELIEPDTDRWNQSNDNALSDRLFADLGGNSDFEEKRDRVRLGRGRAGAQGNEGDGNDDNRALVAYLQAFTPGALTGLPEWALKPLNPDEPDLINPTQSGLDVGVEDSGWIDLLGIHDAWGVPLDYFHYVKLEWAYDRGANGNFDTQWLVRDRRPVIRSRGMDEETYETWLETGRDDTLGYNRSGNWIVSSGLPRPWLPDTRLNTLDGRLISVPNGQVASGWVRAVAALEEDTPEDYGYLPSEDPR